MLRNLNTGLSQPWLCAPWQVTYAPLTPSVTEAAVITTQDHSAESRCLLQLSRKGTVKTSNRIPYFSQCNNPKRIPTSNLIQMVILQHIYVFAKVLQVCSPQAEGDAQPLPERSAHAGWLIALAFPCNTGKLNICQGQVCNLPWLGPACHSFL